MPLEKLALYLAIALAAIWCVAMFSGLVATLPYGLPVLAVFLVVLYLIYRVIRDRLQNTEDDYYEKNVEK